jgi:hypothetical protein
MKRFYYSAAATVTALVMAAPALAGNNFSSIGSNVIASLRDMPGLLSGVAYLFGLLLGVTGILKIKDSVENPAQTPLKDGAIRMLAGGALFALPVVFEAMQNTIGQGGGGVAPATLAGVAFGPRGGGGCGGSFGCGFNF